MDPFVALALQAVAHQVHTGRPLPQVPPELDALLPRRAAGVFVSLHSGDGTLRGCMGTFRPCEERLALEVVANAARACAHDPRFPPVTPAELPGLSVSVDVLSDLEPVTDASELDPRRFGVVVSTPDGRRGLLLPDLEGVDTVEAQVRIACRKAGIHPNREKPRLQRFTVERHA